MSLSRFVLQKKEKFAAAIITPSYNVVAFQSNQTYGSWTTNHQNGLFSAYNARFNKPATTIHKLQLTFSLDQASEAYEAIKSLLFSENNPIYRWEITAPSATGQVQVDQTAQLTLHLHPDDEGTVGWLRRTVIAGFVEELEKKLSAHNIRPAPPPANHVHFNYTDESFWKYTSYYQSPQSNVQQLKTNFVFQKLFGVSCELAGEYTQFYYDGDKLFFMSPFDGKNRPDPRGNGLIYYHHTGKIHNSAGDGQNKLHISVHISEIHRAFETIRDLLIDDNSPVYRWKIIDTDYYRFSPTSNERMHQAAQITLYLSVDQDLSQNGGYSQTHAQAINNLILQIERRLDLAQIRQANIKNPFNPSETFHHPVSDVAASHWKYLSYRKETGSDIIPDERVPTSTEQLNRIHSHLQSQPIFQSLSSSQSHSTLTLYHRNAAYSFDLTWQPIHDKIRTLYGIDPSDWPKLYPRLPNTNITQGTSLASLQIDNDEAFLLIKDIESFARQKGIALPDKNQLTTQTSGAIWRYQTSDGKNYLAYSRTELQLKVLASYIEPSIANLSKIPSTGVVDGYTHTIHDNAIMYVYGYGDSPSNQNFHGGKARQERAYAPQHLSAYGSHSTTYIINGKTVILQPTSYACGITSAAMLSNDYGIAVNPQHLFYNEAGTMRSIYTHLEKIGLTPLYTEHYHHIDDLAEAIKQRGSAIAVITARNSVGHALVIDNIDLNKRIVTIRDPFDGLMKDVALSAFDTVWAREEGSLQIRSPKRSIDEIDPPSPRKLRKNSLPIRGSLLTNSIIEGNLLLKQAIQSAATFNLDKKYIPVFTVVENNTTNDDLYRFPLINATDENDVKWVTTNDNIFDRLKKNNQQQAAHIKQHTFSPKIKPNLLSSTSPSALFSTPSSIALLLKGWNNWSWNIPHDPNPSTDRILQAHHLVNTLQLFQGTALSTATVLKAASLILKQPLSKIPSKTPNLLTSMANSARLLKFAGGQALPYVNTLLDGLDFGFSTYEFSLARGSSQNVLLGTRLAISGSNLAVGGAALLGIISKSTTLTHIANSASLPLAIFSIMASSYIDRHIQAKNVQEKTLALAQIWDNIDTAYQTPVALTTKNNINYLMPAHGIAIDEINFITKEITFGEHRLYRAKQEQNKLKNDAGYVDEFINIPESLGIIANKKTLAHSDTQVVFLPHTPSHHFYYVYEIADYETIAHNGMKVMKAISRQKEGFSPTFYKVTGDYPGKRLGTEAYTTEYVATDRKITEKATTIKIVLDQQQRDLYTPKFEQSQDAKNISYDIEGSGGTYFLYLEKNSNVNISNQAQKTSTWTIDTSQYKKTHEAIQVNNQRLTVNGQTILRFNQSVKNLHILDQQHTLTEFYEKETQSDASSPITTSWHQRVLVIDWEQWRPHTVAPHKFHSQDTETLITHLNRLNQNGQLAQQVEIKNYLLYPNTGPETSSAYIKTSAYYDSTATSAERRFLVLPYYEIAELNRENGYQFTLSAMKHNLKHYYGEKTSTEKDAISQLAQQVDKKFSQYYQLGHQTYIDDKVYLSSLKDCTNDEKKAKHYQYVQLWISRLEDKVRELKEMESWINDAKLIGTIGDTVYFYSKKHSLIWSGNLNDHRDNKNAYTTFFYLLGKGAGHTIQGIIHHQNTFLIECKYTFTNNIEANIWYRLDDQKIYLEAIRCTSNTWASLTGNTALITTLLNEENIPARKSDELQFIEQGDAGKRSHVLHWQSTPETSSQASTPLLNKTQYKSTQFNSFFTTILTNHNTLHGWLNLESKTFVQPNLKDANEQTLTVLPSDLSIGAYTKSGTTELFYFYSVKDSAVWVQIGSGTGLANSTSTPATAKYVAITGGIKRLLPNISDNDTIMVENQAGLIYTIDITGHAQLTGITSDWLNQQATPWWQAVPLLATQHNTATLDIFARKAQTPLFWYRNGHLIVASPSLKNQFDSLVLLNLHTKNNTPSTEHPELIYLLDTQTGLIYTQHLIPKENLGTLLANEAQLTQSLNAVAFSQDIFKSVKAIGAYYQLITSDGIILFLNNQGKLELHGVDQSWQTAHPQRQAACQALVASARTKGWEIKPTFILEETMLWYHTETQQIIAVPSYDGANGKLDDLEFIDLGIDPTISYFYSSKKNTSYEVKQNTITALTGIYFSTYDDLVIALGSKNADTFGTTTQQTNRRLPTLSTMTSALLNGEEGQDTYHIDAPFKQAYPHIEINNFDPTAQAQTDTLRLSVNQIENLFLYKENEHLYLTEIDNDNPLSTYEIKLASVYSKQAAAYRHLSFKVEDRKTSMKYEHSIDLLIDAMSRAPSSGSDFDQSMYAYQDFAKTLVATSI